MLQSILLISFTILPSTTLLTLYTFCCCKKKSAKPRLKPSKDPNPSPTDQLHPSSRHDSPLALMQQQLLLQQQQLQSQQLLLQQMPHKLYILPINNIVAPRRTTGTTPIRSDSNSMLNRPTDEDNENSSMSSPINIRDF